MDVGYYSLSIVGGYDSVCSARTTAAETTVLDGNGSDPVLTLNAPVWINDPSVLLTVSGLTFQNGRTSSTQGSVAGGLKIGDPGPIYTGQVHVEGNIFRNNDSSGATDQFSAGALSASTDADGLVVRNNVFVGNKGEYSGAVALFSNNPIAVINNTFVGNTANQNQSADRTILSYWTFSGITVANNIFWQNSVPDLNFDAMQGFGLGPQMSLVTNMFQTSAGVAKAEQGSLHLDPQFIAPQNWHLTYVSPMVDAGTIAAIPGLPTTDLDGNPRVDNGKVDIGAYESSYIFVSNFDL